MRWSVLGVGLMAIVSIGRAQPDNTDCVMDPSHSRCSDYALPTHKATAQLQDICTQDPGLVGCSLSRYCIKPSQAQNTSKLCSPFSLLATVCAVDSPRMRGCSTYVAMCRHSSIVRQCANERGANLPRTTDLRATVKNLCALHQVEGCQGCMENESKCDALNVYSNYCRNQVDDAACSDLSQFCNATLNVPNGLCPNPPPPPPPPQLPPNATLPIWRPYLHISPPDYLLFNFVILRNTLHLLLAATAAFSLAFLHTTSSALILFCETKWANATTTTTQNLPSALGGSSATGQPLVAEPEDSGNRVFGRRGTTTVSIDSDIDGERGPLLGSPSSTPLSTIKAFGLNLSIRTLRTLLDLLAKTLFVLSLLLCMSFNVVIIGGVLLGWALGTFAMGGWQAPAAIGRITSA
ncbi:hypothetical protein DFS34DRAFT_604642 [Phlyctochytrium arcticum]|nr:hypothetical protein DFS34DRAFT_604642 [Phlyctochytrium arcticum]